MIEKNEIVILPSGEATIEASISDLNRASEYLANIENDNAQGHASDLRLAAELLDWLAFNG